MLLAATTIEGLERLLAPHMDQGGWPGLRDAAVRDRARQYARETGLWDSLAEAAAPVNVIPATRYSDYFHYERTGSRERHDVVYVKPLEQLRAAAMALWLGHPAANREFFQDLLWRWCESFWINSAHTRQRIDLNSVLIGITLAEYSWLFADILDPRVRARIDHEIDTRLLSPALDWRQPDWWQTTGNNWNTVCNGCLVEVALYQIRQPLQLATFVHHIARRMDYAINYFTPDGGCPEGASYWEYGFSHFLSAALALQTRTGGAVNLADDPRIERICRFPLAVQLHGMRRATFSDCSDGALSGPMALLINRFIKIPQLFKIVAPGPTGHLALSDIRSLCLYENQRPDPTPDAADYFLPDLAYAKVRAGNVCLAVAGGNNGVSHNHNDLGSFMLLYGDRILLTDPGAPVYNDRTFGSHRYEMLVCRSRGHSVPLINGQEQQFGEKYRATIAAVGLNGAGAKTVTLDLARAYADPTLAGFTRKFHLEPAGGLRITDTFSFTADPSAVQEAFVTFEDVRMAADARSVLLGEAARLLAEAPGVFAITNYSAKEHEGRDPRPLHRIVFVPAQLERSMRLVFGVVAV